MKIIQKKTQKKKRKDIGVNDFLLLFSFGFIFVDFSPLKHFLFSFQINFWHQCFLLCLLLVLRI